jgi:hypothetical protein
LVAGAGGLRFAGSSEKYSSSERRFGAIRASSEPTLFSSPAKGVGTPPKANHGVELWSCWREVLASSSLIVTGVLPPSMYTSPDRPRPPALPPKSQVA